MADDYIGIQQQIRTNNQKSILLLIGFPLLIFLMVYVVLLFTLPAAMQEPGWQIAGWKVIEYSPIITGVVVIWFLIAYWGHSQMISAATHSKPLERKENKRVYNLVENLCIQDGMRMPKVKIIEDSGMNAFASGLNEKSYTVTLTRGLIEELDDEELKGVIAHELMHIRNKDVRLLVITIIFVGIFSLIVQIAFRSLLYGSIGRRRNDKGGGAVVLVIIVVAAVAYFLSLIFKFALSRRREYMADSGAVEMTKNSKAMASALRKISGRSEVASVESEDVKEMFIEHSPKDSKGFFSTLAGWFSTHPPIEKRIEILEQF
ncbi:MAG: M48 family metalloprotease [Bacteroidetes bacterium]|jgi:heat shock protein HtpX|nr:M48 family metalloprotease [Bacteroidota bacterium]